MLAGEHPPQLRMLVLGHGGTGKSMLIGTITETFKALRSEDKLAKCATSGVAAVIIGGPNTPFVGRDSDQQSTKRELG